MKKMPRDERQQENGFEALNGVADLVGSASAPPSPRAPASPRAAVHLSVPPSPRALASPRKQISDRVSARIVTLKQSGSKLRSTNDWRTTISAPKPSVSEHHERSIFRLANSSEVDSASSFPEPPFTSGLRIVVRSPYRDESSNDSSRSGDGDQAPSLFFSKELLIRMDHGKHHLVIDLLRPEGQTEIFPLEDLSPLCLYRQLRTLKIVGMMQSYQWYIWLVVWLNPELVELDLEMVKDGERLDSSTIKETREYARSKPTMREAVRDVQTYVVLKKLPIARLSLTNFVVEMEPFFWFSGTRLEELELRRCNHSGFSLPEKMQASVRVTVED